MADEPILSPEPATPPADPAAPATPPVDPATASAEPIVSTPTPLVNHEGAFSEGWKDSLPEDIRDEKCLDNVTDLPNAIKQLVSHKKMVGANKIVVPTDKSTPEEWGAFYDAVGRPTTADDYKVDVPDDLKEIFSDERMGRAKAQAHKLGITQQQFESYLKDEMQEATQIQAANAENIRQNRVKTDEALRTEFGAAYDERIHVAKRLIAEAIPNGEQQMAFIEKFGDDPDFIRFASIAGSRLVEHKALLANLTQDTPGEAKKKIADLNATPGYMDQSSKMTPEERTAITEKIRELYKQANPVETGR